MVLEKANLKIIQRADTLRQICNCGTAFSFCFSKRKRCSSETASPERVSAIREASYPLSPLPPLQIANAALVCNLRPGGISMSPRSLLEPTKETAANPYSPANFERRAFLPQQSKRTYLQIRCTVTGGAYHSVRRGSMCVRNTRKSGFA